MEFSECELGCSVDGHEEVELALSCLHFGNVDMEIANGVALEPLLDRFIALHLGQPRDTVPLQRYVRRRLLPRPSLNLPQNERIAAYQRG